jgi:hypothetical protein
MYNTDNAIIRMKRLSLWNRMLQLTELLVLRDYYFRNLLRILLSNGGYEQYLHSYNAFYNERLGLVNGKLMLAVIIARNNSGALPKAGIINTSNKDYCYKWCSNKLQYKCDRNHNQYYLC